VLVLEKLEKQANCRLDGGSEKVERETLSMMMMMMTVMIVVVVGSSVVLRVLSCLSIARAM
jgi:hypothetical protein